VFDIRTPAGGGFTVVIEIPYERHEVADRLSDGSAKPSARPTVSTAPEQRTLGLDA